MASASDWSAAGSSSTRCAGDSGLACAARSFDPGGPGAEHRARSTRRSPTGSADRRTSMPSLSAPSPASEFSSGSRPKASRSAMAPSQHPRPMRVNADSPGVQVRWRALAILAAMPARTPPTLDDVRRAAARLDGVAHRTPGRHVAHARRARRRRGRTSRPRACSAPARSSSAAPTTPISSLTDAERRSAACSPPRRATTRRRVALAARLCGTRATILMPHDAPASKRAATEGYGAEVIGFDRYADDREQLLAELAAERGLHVVHPYDDPRVMAGAGTTALELLEDAGELDLLVVPGRRRRAHLAAARPSSRRSRRRRASSASSRWPPTTSRARRRSGRRERVVVGKTIADGQQLPTPGRAHVAGHRRARRRRRHRLRRADRRGDAPALRAREGRRRAERRERAGRAAGRRAARRRAAASASCSRARTSTRRASRRWWRLGGDRLGDRLGAAGAAARRAARLQARDEQRDDARRRPARRPPIGSAATTPSVNACGEA